MHQRKQNSKASYIVGLMSGTSADGIDAVVAAISTKRRLQATVVAHLHHPFPQKLTAKILDISLHGHVAEICELNFYLGEWFAEAALASA